MTFYDDPNRQCVGLLPAWGTKARDNVAQATGATAGIPGSWTPANTDAPDSVAALQSATIAASPATVWTTGQYVQTQTTGVGGRAHWNGSAWIAGAKP